MAEPATTTATVTGAAAAGGVISVVGGVIHVAGITTGVPLDLILPAFCGALWSLRKADPGGNLVRVAQVLIGTLIASGGAAAAVALLVLMIPGAGSVDPAPLRWPSAFLIGWGGLRLVLPWLERRLGGPAAEERQS